MTRVQILLPEEQDRRLEELASRQGASKAELVRRALDLLFRSESAENEPLLDLIGQAGRSGRRHASRDHDRILAATERRRQRRS
jgi:Arc/MetJ-type ribon-helix-helix transcriptional regulator